MRLAISGEGLGSVMGLEEIVLEFAKVGVRAIELWPENVPVCAGRTLVHKRLYANRDFEKAAEILRAHRVDVACVAFGAAFDAELAADQELYAAELTRAVEAAAALGAKRVNHYCYHIGMDGPLDADRMHRYYDRATRRAEELGVVLALENEAHDCTRDPRQMRAIVEEMHSPAFRTNYDATNYYQAGFEAYPLAYEMLRDQIAHVHIKNGCIYRPESGHNPLCRGGDMTGRLEGNAIFYPPAGEGAVPVETILRRLAQDGYIGFCSLEPHTTPELCIEYYRMETEFLYKTGRFTPER